MTDALEALIAKAQKIKMTEGQLRQQRLSFVYGNTHIENAQITRQMVAEADERVAQEEASNRPKAMSDERHSEADAVELIADPAKKAQREAENGVRQFRAALEIIVNGIMQPAGSFRLNQRTIFL